MMGTKMNETNFDDQVRSERSGRRRFLRSTGACLALLLPHGAKAHSIGIVDPPISLPLETSVVRHDGLRMLLRNIIQGRRTLLQLMFTGCSEICPLQGALFAEIQEKSRQLVIGKNQLLSLSIDPMDDARSLSAWLSQFGASRNWGAAVSSPKGIDAIRASLQGTNGLDRDHSSQVYFLDETGRLVWRTEEFPSLEVVHAIAQRNNWLSS
jgi:protein SCO1/2